MIVVFWYVVLLWLALCGLIILACLYVAMWTVAGAVAIVMILIRAARGQRGDEMLRQPFTPRFPRLIKRPVPQAKYSNRR